MRDKKKFIDLREQTKGAEEATTKRVRKNIAYSLIVLMLCAVACACISGINGGSIQIWALAITTKGSISAACILAVASFVAYRGGLGK